MFDAFIDKLQELFPPNRVAILFAGIITAVSGSIAAFLAAHFPGLEFGSAEIAGVLGAAVLITLRLLDRWFDRWQEGERVDYAEDVRLAVEELSDSPEVRELLDEALGSIEGFRRALDELHKKVVEGSVSQDDVSAELAAILEAVSIYLHGPTNKVFDQAADERPEIEPATASVDGQ